jgi:hypothetical protein
MILKFFPIFLLLTFSTCPAQDKNYIGGVNGNDTIAQIDSLKITMEEFYLSYEYGPAFVKRERDSKERYLNYMVNEKLMALDGYSRGIDTSKQAIDMLDEFKNDIAAEELFNQDILSRIKIEQSEIDSVISKKNLVLEIRWLYAKDDEGIKSYLNQIKSGISFDSLYYQQFRDSVFQNDRWMKIDRYRLERKNPALAVIIDSLRAREISLPLHTDDGWYIMKLENVTQNLITTESEYERMKQESINSLKKEKMDKLSDQYVNEIMIEHNPIIKRDAFNFLRSYLGNVLLPHEKYTDWNLSEKLSTAIKNLNVSNENEYAQTTLIELNNSKFTIDDFLTWFRNRSLYINLDEKDLKDFSISLENLIWRMVRDRLLSRKAIERGLANTESVVKQSRWWRDKIVSSIVRNEIANSVILDNKETKTNSIVDSSKEQSAIYEEFSVKLLRKILALKKKYEVSINKDLLNEIYISDEDNPRAVNFYFVKQGGLIPRTPYPTINPDWISWE